MNRRERRQTAKNLGILQYQQKLPRNKKFELMRENIILGHKQEKEFREEVKRRQELSEDQKDEENIQHMAKQIADKEKMSLIDALEIAQKRYAKIRKR
jgi:hypothetical protein